MKFKRNIYNELLSWKESKNRKPLVLLGARQVGKTHILKEFGKTYKNFYYINIESSIEFIEIFENSNDVHTIFRRIQFHLEQKIDIENSLLFFDEIQASSRAITMLKYFNEEYSDLHIVCAGSLLGVSLNRGGYSIPVGKINTKYMYPMMFDEFLLATDNKFLKEELEKSFYNKKAVDTVLHKSLLRLYNEYLCTGGMPGAIVEYVDNNKDILSCNEEFHSQIILDYLEDMGKYADNSTTLKCRAIYNSIPEQLSGDSTKFKYSIVAKGSQRAHYENSIEWLLSSKVNIEIQRVNSGNIPLKVHVQSNDFKIYLSDIGLLRSLSDVSIYNILSEKNVIFKGALTENYVAIHLNSLFKNVYYYKDNRHEVDFITRIKNDIIPIEVKASKNTRSLSLQKYIDKYDPAYAIRLSTKNFNFENKIRSIPLYAVYLLNKL